MKRGVQIRLGIVFLIHESATQRNLPLDVFPLLHSHESSPRNVGDVDGVLSVIGLLCRSGAVVTGANGCGQGVDDELAPKSWHSIRI